MTKMARRQTFVFYSPTETRNLTHKYVIKKYLKNTYRIWKLTFHASFGTFCVQKGQLFEAPWAFEGCLIINKFVVFEENVADFEFLRMFKDSLRLE